MPEPIPFASTVVLLRPGMDVFLMKRHGKSGFMGGVHVFPGGKVDEDDRAPDWTEVIGPAAVSPLTAKVPGLTETDARALIVASIRETLEEAGVILGGPAPAGLDAVQQKLNASEMRFLDWIRETNVRLDTDRLAFFDHWITPPIEKKRFDTFFFAAAIPEGQTATSVSRETTEGVWMQPAEAVDLYRAGEIMLAPPTCTTLLRLSRFRDPGEAIESLRRRPVATMLPKVSQENGQMILMLPGHPGYGPHEGELDPEGPSCVRMNGGKWFPETR